MGENKSENKLTNEQYADLIVKYSGDLSIVTEYGINNYTIINQEYAVANVPVEDFKENAMERYGWNQIPSCYGLLDTGSLEVSGIIKTQNIPQLALRGSGVLVGIIDTGIDYTHPAFQNDDKTSRILYLWDQTIQNSNIPNLPLTPYGTTYTREQINTALASNNPLDIVPSTDENGHGTMLAGIAAGSRIDSAGFYGIVPEADLIVVKLKEAKKYLKEFFLIPNEAVCYQASDIQFAVRYIRTMALELNRPVAICLALGTSSGLHDGSDFLSMNLNYIADTPGIAVIVAAGNEGNSKTHYYGLIDSTIGYDNVELKVGKDVSGFTMELWGNIPNMYSVEIISPSGEFIYRIPARLNEKRTINFLFDRTTLYINYVLFDLSRGNQLILFRFVTPAEGVWRIRVYGKGGKNIDYNIWLPIRSFLNNDTYFMKPNPDTTITSPGNTNVPITVTAYDHQHSTLFIEDSRGYTSVNIIKPDFAAPGVDVYAPGLHNTYVNSTGTSAAAAHTTGVAAMLLEWGIIRKNLLTMSSPEIKSLLIRGAKRDPTISYPNKEWGYGTLDVYNTYITFRS